MRFEKWQALGNDYVIVDAADLPAALTPCGPGAVRPPHRHRRRRRPPAPAAGRAGVRRAAADLQPGRLGGRAQRQRRARGDPVPAPPGLDRPRPVLDPDDRGGDPPDDPVGDDLPRGHGPRAPAVEGLPVRRRTGRARSRPAGARSASSTSSIGNPQCAIAVASTAELDALDLGAIGPGDRARRAVPEPDERLVVRRARAGRHPRADLRARGGGDDRLGHRRERRRRRLRPARRRLAGHGPARRRRPRGRRRARTSTST